MNYLDITYGILFVLTVILNVLALDYALGIVCG